MKSLQNQFIFKKFIHVEKQHFYSYLLEILRARLLQKFTACGVGCAYEKLVANLVECWKHEK